jgi:hypothetical protein
MILHQRTHPSLDVDGCFACRVAAVNIGGAALVTRTPEVGACIAREKRWDKDHPAYKSLRKEGIQPRTSDGAHEMMMTAATREQIEGLPKLHKDRHEILADAIPRAS